MSGFCLNKVLENKARSEIHLFSSWIETFSAQSNLIKEVKLWAARCDSQRG